MCEILKFDPRRHGNEVILEEEVHSESVSMIDSSLVVRKKAPKFDVTPIEMVTGVVTENGLLTPKAVLGLMTGYRTA